MFQRVRWRARRTCCCRRMLVPISVSGVGVREVLFALVFPALGYGVEAGVGLGLLVFAVMYLAPIAAGFASFQAAPPPSGPAPGPT